MIRKLCKVIILVSLVYLAGVKLHFWGASSTSPSVEEPAIVQIMDKKDKQEHLKQQETKQQETKQQGMESQDNDLNGQLISISKVDKLQSPFGDKTGPFVVVKFAILNQSQSPVTIVGFGIKMEDTQGNTYALDNDGMGALFHQRISTFHMTNINPGMSQTASVVFKVSRNVTPSKIVVRPHGSSLKLVLNLQ